MTRFQIKKRKNGAAGEWYKKKKISFETFYIDWSGTYHLSNELCRLCLPTHRQQGQAKVKHHKLLHSGEVLLTKPAVLRQHQCLETATALQHRMSIVYISTGDKNS